MKNKDGLPSKAQIRAEILEAEARGIHKEPVDFLDEACMEQVVSGHLDDTLIKPSVEELTR